ncbi:MAG TPA: nucleotidyltransferase domain-containing protein [Candidatus Paceibacterota bacterium]
MASKRIPEKIIQVVKGYSDRLEQQEHIPVERVIVYGSYAKGTPKKWSDVDVCIISPEFNRPFEAMTLLWRKRNREEVLAGIEPVGFTSKDFEEGSSLINEIKRTGIDLPTRE